MAFLCDKKYDDDIPEGHAFAETRSLHPDDDAIRAAGFKIHARPKNGAPIWDSAEGLFTHAQALESARLREWIQRQKKDK